VSDLYNENYKPMKKEAKKDYRMWKALPCSSVGINNIIKMSILPKTIQMFSAI
jgi:hypothetical protein